MIRQINDEGIELVKKFEGCRLTAYLCPAKVWTIGYGHTHGVTKGMAITQDQADEMLAEDLANFGAGVQLACKVPLSDNQYAALVSFTYNVGLGALLKSTLLKRLNEGKYQEAAEQFKVWNKAAGKVLRGLVVRRLAEETLFKKEPTCQ